MISRFLLIAALGMTGCATSAPNPGLPTRAAVVADPSLPPMKSFAAPRPAAPVASNRNIAKDFLELHFALESGRTLPVFTRFEGPIAVRVTGPAPASLNADLGRLINRLRSEAGIDIRQARGSEPHNITVQAVSRADIRKALPHAACFVVPNVDSFDEFRQNRRAAKTNWALLNRREKIAIFLPYDSSPQDMRDCLHEELAQALGPLNDLYRLPQSVFNDDNVHTVLTGFDMLILRATYAPDLTSGMNRETVAARLPGILSRINPRGDALPETAVAPTPRSWIRAVHTTLGPDSTEGARRSAAQVALRIASDMGWQDHRRAFSHYMVGRMMARENPDSAQSHFKAAQSYLAATPGTDLHRAFIATQTAAYAVSRGDGSNALRQISGNIETAARAENAALMSTLMLLQASALDQTGRSDQARSVRLDSLGWARYGFGPDWAVRAKVQEISALTP